MSRSEPPPHPVRGCGTAAGPAVPERAAVRGWGPRWGHAEDTERGWGAGEGDGGVRGVRVGAGFVPRGAAVVPGEFPGDAPVHPGLLPVLPGRIPLFPAPCEAPGALPLTPPSTETPQGVCITAHGR